MLAVNDQISTAYLAGRPGSTAVKSNVAPVLSTVTAKPIVSGIVPVTSVPTPAPSPTPQPILPVESLQTGYYFGPDEAPVAPNVPATIPSLNPGGITAGSAGMQVTSGASGSHDTVGISGSLLDSLATIGAPTSANATPTTTPDSSTGMWLLAGVAIFAVWYLLK